MIKLLFSSKPTDYAESELKPMKYFPLFGYKFMMWCGKLIYKESNESLINAFMKTTKGIRCKRHETVHLKQAQKHADNSWTKYYWTYFIEWLNGNPFFPPFKSAYYTIPYEMEAYALETRQTLVDNYDETLLEEKYTIKDRKKTYKEHKDDWKSYVRSI